MTAAASSHPSLIVVGASAGGIEALTTLVGGLPGGFPAAIAVVLHLPPSGTSVLPAILDRASPLPATAASDGDQLRPGHVFVAPSDHHLIVNPGELALSHGPRENGHRPSIDTLLRTAAGSYGEQVIGVILSGTLDDGAAGLALIKRAGGIAIVQDPDDALYDGMPRAALERTEVDHVAAVRDIPRLLVETVRGRVDRANPRPDPPDTIVHAPIGHGDVATGFICPECGGALWEVDEAGVSRFRCRIGHAFSEETLVDEQGEMLENALWSALRVLEERAELLQRMAARSQASGHERAARNFTTKSGDALRQAEIIRAGVLPVAVDVTPTGEDVAP
jgi:two-component system, chemotaxis family, protein-glutamate methylesterase/glutaminase